MTEFEARKGKEGNRWFNERPSAEDVTTWFAEAVKLPEGLSHDNYIGGVVLIPGKEKANEPMGFNEKTGVPIWTEVENLVFTPYVKVETRVQYWTDLLAANADEWLGVIEPVAPQGGAIEGLPPGFARLRVKGGEKGETPYVLCTMKATVFDRKTVQVKEYRNTETGEIVHRYYGPTIIDAAPATKQVPMLGRWGPDDSAIMKAQTGAIGRALGMAGMLIVPGTGVATAEDMRELAYQQAEPVAAREEAPPSVEGRAGKDASAEPTQEELVAMASGLIVRLQATDEAVYTAFLAWCKERKFNGKVAEMDAPTLKQVIKKVEQALAEVEAAAKA